MTVHLVISPKDSNSDLSQSSSTFHEREPINRFLLFSSAPDSSFFAFFATGEASTSALRFLSSLGFASSSEEDSSESESESESEDESD
jgi:hypothetical protein